MTNRNQIQVFSKEEFGSIRVAGEGRNALFCLVDVGKSLGYARPRDAIRSYCRSFVELSVCTKHGARSMRFGKISEVFRLIMKSKCEKAQVFQDWVCEEVLPSIMETGAYSIAERNEMQDGFNREVVAAMAETRKVLANFSGEFTELKNISAELDDKVVDIEKRIEVLENRKTHTAEHDTVAEKKPEQPTKTLVISTYPSSLTWIGNILRDLKLSWTMEPKNEGTSYDIIIQEVISGDRAEVINRISFRKPNYKKYITIKTL